MGGGRDGSGIRTAATVWDGHRPLAGGRVGLQRWKRAAGSRRVGGGRGWGRPAAPSRAADAPGQRLTGHRLGIRGGLHVGVPGMGEAEDPQRRCGNGGRALGARGGGLVDGHGRDGDAGSGGGGRGRRADVHRRCGATARTPATFEWTIEFARAAYTFEPLPIPWLGPAAAHTGSKPISNAPLRKVYVLTAAAGAPPSPDHTAPPPTPAVAQSLPLWGGRITHPHQAVRGGGPRGGVARQRRWRQEGRPPGRSPHCIGRVLRARRKASSAVSATRRSRSPSPAIHVPPTSCNACACVCVEHPVNSPPFALAPPLFPRSPSPPSFSTSHPPAPLPSAHTPARRGHWRQRGTPPWWWPPCDRLVAARRPAA